LKKSISEKAREKFRKNGGESLTDEEYLALLLSYTPVSDPDTVSEKLLKTYGSFSALADTDPKLIQSENADLQTAVLLRLISRFASLCDNDAGSVKYLLTAEKAGEYFAGMFSGAAEEQLAAAAVNKRLMLTAAERIAYGNAVSVSTTCREIADFIIRHGAEYIFLAHVHPVGCPEASPTDISSTESIVRTARSIGAEVVDHIIISGRKSYSMRSAGVCKEFDKNEDLGYIY
jgi:DNA repair protein RadC